MSEIRESDDHQSRSQQQPACVSVKDRISQALNLLPSHLLLSEKPKHILSRTTINLESEGYAPSFLDTQRRPNPKILKFAQEMFNNYGNNLNSLMKASNKIVFMSLSAQQKYQQYQTQLQNGEQQEQPTQFGAVQQYQTSKNDTQTQCANKNWAKVNHSQLQFGDEFQSSNIYMALKQADGTYIVTTRLDYNTYSYGQWFYFRIKNITKNNKKYRLSVVNMTKTSSMFGKGLKISVCREGVWKKEGEDISYEPNHFRRKFRRQFRGLNSILTFRNQLYHSLIFTVNVNAGQEIYVAYNQPYTFSRLGRVMDKLVLKTYDSKHVSVKRTVLARTILDNSVDMLTVTLPNGSDRRQIEERQIIVITARTHPVQTAGSFVMEGIIQQLCKEQMNEKLASLLENYIIKLVPMVNPDGVIIGNSRCNLRGYDLNRRWNQPDPAKTPQVASILKMILKSPKKVAMFIDLHAHSKKKNVFAYGCHDNSEPFATRQFPYLLSKINKDDFLFKECRFTVPLVRKKSNKEGTARVTLWRKLKTHNIFTIQNSYCSAQGSQYHYDESSYKTIGRSILEGICLYFASGQNSVKNTKNNITASNLEQKSMVLSQFMAEKSRYLQQLRQDQNNIALGLLKIDDSESQPQDRASYNKNKQAKNKSNLNKSKDKKKSSSLFSHTERNPQNAQSKIAIKLDRTNRKTILSEKKISRPFKTIQSQRKLDSMVQLKKVPFETGLPRTNSNNQTGYNKGFRNLIPLKNNPYKKAKKPQQFMMTAGKLNPTRSSRSIYVRQHQQDFLSSDYKDTRQNMLSIVEFGADCVFPDSGRRQKTLKNGLFHKPRKLIDLGKICEQKKTEPIGPYHVKNALRRPNYDKLQELISKINRNMVCPLKKESGPN